MCMGLRVEAASKYWSTGVFWRTGYGDSWEKKTERSQIITVTKASMTKTASV